ncbi:plakophilin-3 isoform X2 [Latimeria chalumnae]|uniref:plakophilin-3 isoform X2 n=1 Tax=Latimeria chalumnae TaxID=7897 RepID=UPI00313E562E
MPVPKPDLEVSSLALPSDYRLGQKSRGGVQETEQVKTQRLHEQVRLRMMQRKSSFSKSSGSLHNFTPTREASVATTFKYPTVPANFNTRSQSHTITGNWNVSSMPRSSIYGGKSGTWSSRSAVDMNINQRISNMSQVRRQGEEFTYRRQSSRPQSMYGTTMHGNARQRQDYDTISLRSIPVHNGPVGFIGHQDDEVDSQASEKLDQQMRQSYNREAYGSNQGTFQKSYILQNQTVIGNNMGSVPSMTRSTSGTIYQAPIGTVGAEAEERVVRGPSARTLQRLQSTQRNISRVNSSSFGSMQQNQNKFVYQMLPNGGGGSSGAFQQISRAPSMKSLTDSNIIQRGNQGDMLDGPNVLISQQSLTSGFDDLNLSSAVKYLVSDDPSFLTLGAAYIQHKCYQDNEARREARYLQAIPYLVKLFNHENQEVQRHVTGAMRNLIYNNTENKTALIDAGGIRELKLALQEHDDEVQKNVTGILWNLSSHETLKDRLADEILQDLVTRDLSPLSGKGSREVIQQNVSEMEIFYNATGYLRNLSSASENTRQKMRNCPELVDSMVHFVQESLKSGKAEEKSVENAVCVLRNLSFRLYEEIPSSTLERLEGPSRAEQNDKKNGTVGCFTPQSKKIKEKRNTDLVTFTEVSKDPKGMEWLWNPQIVKVYHDVLQKSELNQQTLEGAAGALQNITSGNTRWASVLSRVALDQERVLNTISSQLKTKNEQQLKSLTGLIRNLCPRAQDKNEMSRKLVEPLLERLPGDKGSDQPSSETIINICAVLNSLVVVSSSAPREIVYFKGLRKLMYLKNQRDSPANEKIAKVASDLLSNLWQHTKFHRDYKSEGYSREDFLQF